MSDLTSMQLPDLTNTKRFNLSKPPGSADAALLATLIDKEVNVGRRVAIFTADAFDAQRLIDELPFSPQTFGVCFSQIGKRCPMTIFRRTKI